MSHDPSLKFTLEVGGEGRDKTPPLWWVEREGMKLLTPKVGGEESEFNIKKCLMNCLLNNLLHQI